MKKLLLRLVVVVLLGTVGYWVGTGAAAAEWRAFRFWNAHREDLPMLEARATWALEEVETAIPPIHWPALMTQPESNAFAASLVSQFGPEEGSTPPAAPLYTKAQLELHRERSASLKSYTDVREAAARPSFHQMMEEHTAMLGKRLDSDHTITVSIPVKLSVRPASTEEAADWPAPHRLEWRLTLNLSTRERLRSEAHLVLPAPGDR